jgi:hypothetical protein
MLIRYTTGASMPVLMYFCAAVLVAAVVNLLDWQVRGGRFFVWPTGRLGWVFNVLCLANLLAAILYLARVVPDWVLWATMISLGLATETYAIWQRHTRPTGDKLTRNA